VIDACVTVVDSGLFGELAVRLSREFTKVRSFVPWRAEFPSLNDRAVGSGLPEVEWVEDAFRDDIFDTTDVYCFPDIFFAGEQQLLRRCGKPTWGSNSGDELETRRIWFRHLQEELGMPVPESVEITGWTALAEFLKNHGHCFIKTTSKIRGTMETKEFFDFDQAEYWLWNLRVKAGCGAEEIVFLVEEPVESPFETGLDTYCIDGQFPKTPMQGIEVKGKLILSSAQTTSATPRPLDDALSVLAPELKKRQYRNFISAEFRKDILTDFCARAPNPGIGVEMEMISNLGEIVYHGAHGDLVEPDFEFEFGIQAAIFHDDPEADWKQFRLDPEIRRWVKLMEFCLHNEKWQIIPRPPHGQKIGWLLGVGDSIEAASKHLQENAEALEGYPFDIKLDALPEAVKQATAAESAGFEFSDQPIPDPAAVLEEK
jgi:hypothetical protein